MNAGMFYQMMGSTLGTSAKTSGTQKTGSFSSSGESFKLEMEKAFDVNAKDSAAKQSQPVNKKDEVASDKGKNEAPKAEKAEEPTVKDEAKQEDQKEVCEEAAAVAVTQPQQVTKVVDEPTALLGAVEEIVEADADMVNLTEVEGEDNLLLFKQDLALEADGKLLAQSNADLVKAAMLKEGNAEVEVEVDTKAKSDILDNVDIQVAEGDEEGQVKVINLNSDNEANMQQGMENGSEDMLAQEGVKMSNETLDLSKVNIKVADAPIDTTRSDAAQQMADKIVYKLSQGKHVFDMELNPANLGKINVKVVFDNGSAEIIMTTSSAKAHQLLSSQTDALRAILEGTLGMNSNVELKQAEHAAEQFDRDNFQDQSNEKGQQQEQKKKDTEDVNSFVEKLRLGLTELEYEAV